MPEVLRERGIVELGVPLKEAHSAIIFCPRGCFDSENILGTTEARKQALSHVEQNSDHEVRICYSDLSPHDARSRQSAGG